ncbi:MAG: methyltransferase domain-containing protein [Gammaproteobacteria bacterium]|nr:methyltransferase domain-containing protein [Gammaproteobacteria bacterium]
MAGIDLAASKKMLVAGRLGRRIRHYSLKSYGEYYRMATNGANPEELQLIVDLLTTNETYFFREPDHFAFLQNEVLPNWKEKHAYRVWSAASSSGEEAYSIAMVLMDSLGENASWEVVGSDISSRMLEKARNAHYSMDTARLLPRQYLLRFCLKGVRAQAGTFLIDKKIRERVKFIQLNLNDPLPNFGQFDMVFLRNTLIYFNLKTKEKVVGRVLQTLRRGGYCLVGHAESLMGITDKRIHADIRSIAPTIYQRR